MGKGKIRKWAELETFPFVFQPALGDVLNNDYRLKGQWRETFFQNDHPVILELGCGKGEYTIGLAKMFPSKNFIGVDIKGARMWKGATIVHLEQIQNVGFIRTRIEFIDSFFGTGEVDEIWLTFPDPQSKKRRHKKRLTGARFLNIYGKFLKPDGVIHLKTDSMDLFRDLLDLLSCNGIEPVLVTDDLYHKSDLEPFLAIKTFYEQQFLEKGKQITYIQFQLPGRKTVKECPEE